MGAKPKQTRSPARTSTAGRTPARRVPARKTSRKSTKAGSSTGKTVDAYMASLEGWQAEAAERLRALVRSAAPSLSESFKWGQPVYEDNGPVCYFRSNDDHMTFGFWRGTELDDPDLRLEGDGDRMKHIKIRSGEEVVDSLGDFVRQAVELNQRLGDPTRKAQDRDEVAENEPIGDAELAAIPVMVPEPAAPQEPEPAVTQSGAIPAEDDDTWHDEYQP